MEETVDQITQLKACVNNLTSLLALPAIWTGHDPSRVTTTLLDVIVEMLDLDFAYVRVRNVAGGSPMEEIRLAHGDREASVQEIGHALAPYLTLGSRQASPRIPNPIAEGTASIAVFGVGIQDRAGVFVAGSRRSEFPTEIERLLLQVATNQAAIALQQNWVEERFRTMADSIPEVIWITALEPERVLYRSPSFEQVWGLSVAGLYQNPRLWTETIHPEDRDRVNNTFSLWIAGAEVGYHDIEYRIVRPDGDIRWIHERGALTRNEDAKPVGVCGISTDITEFQRGRATLERNQFYLNEGQRLTHMGSWAFNPAGFFDYWSEELFRIYGLDPKMGAPTLEEYLGTIHPQDRESMAETIRRMHVENCGCDVKKRIVRPDGEIRFIRCVGVPVLENGVLKGFIGTAMDVTEQEQMTQELRRREAYLAEAQRLS